MQFKHGLRSDLRSPGRSALTMFLFFLVAALLGSSLGTVRSVGGTLRTLSESYVTIAAAVLDAGEETPDPDDLEQALAEMEALELPEGARSWSSSRGCRAWLTQAPEKIDSQSVSDYGVLLVRTKAPGAFSTRFTLPAAAEAVLFSEKAVAGKNLELYGEGLEPERCYLVYGRWYVGALGVAFCLETLTPPLEIPDPDNWRQSPGAQDYLALAQRLERREYSLRALFPEDPAVSFPFQQRSVQLAQGRSFTPEELAGGGRVCMISQQLASLEGIELGDRLPLSLYPDSDAEGLGSRELQRDALPEAEYEVVGILRSKDSWKNTVFLPPQAAPELPLTGSGTLLGQFLLDNDRADAFLQAAEAVLPAGVRVTVYDQGYAEAAQPLRLMLRTVSMIALVCVAAGLCFLLLNLWLFVSRQRSVGTLTLRLGAPRSAAPLYFLSAMLPLALPGLAGGVWFSHWAAGAVTRRLGEALARDPGVSTRFSEAKLSLRQTVALIETPVSLGLYASVAGVLLVLSCLLCWLLGSGSVPHSRRRGRRHSLRTRTRTQPLRGGAAKYALLAARRGGFRTAVSLLAPLAAALLLCGLTQTRQSTAARLRELEENSEIRGYFTNLNGSGARVGLLKLQDVGAVAELPQTTRVTITEDSGLQLQIVSALKQELQSVYWYPEESTEGTPELLYLPHYTLFGPTQLPEIPYGSFQDSRLKAASLTRDPPLIYTNSMTDLPQLMFRGEGVRWLEGFSDESMEKKPQGSMVHVEELGPEGYDFDASLLENLHEDWFYQQTAQEESWEAEQEKVRSIIEYAAQMNLLSGATHCVVSDALLAQWKLELGDYFLCAHTGHDNDAPRSGYIQLRAFHVIGVYHGSSPRDPVFAKSRHLIAVGAEGKALLQQYRATLKRLGFSDDPSLSSAVFRFRAADLEGLKQSLMDAGLTEVGDTAGPRKPFLLEDQVLLATKRSVEQRLWYMERIFPVAAALVLALAVILSVLQLLARRRELWLMHCAGTGQGRAFWSLFAEQAGLCLLGLTAGLGLCHDRALLTPSGLRQTAAFGVLWLCGAGLTALLLIRRPLKTTREE